MKNPFTKNRCYNGGNKHDFETIYETIPPNYMGEFNGTPFAFDLMMEKLTRKKYIQSVCKWCGKIVK